MAGYVRTAKPRQNPSSVSSLTSCSMIQSLKNQLAELERAGHALQPGHHHPSNTEMPAVTEVPDLPRPQAVSPKSGASATSEDIDKLPCQPSSSMTASSLAPNLTDDVPAGPAEGDTDPQSPVLYQLASLHQGCPAECPGPGSFEKMMKPINQMIEKKTHFAPVSTAPETVHLLPTRNLPSDSVLDCNCDHLFDTCTRQWCLPLRRRADALVTLYFARNHSVFPILHEDTFRRQYDRIWESAIKDGVSSSVCSGLCKQKSQGQLFPATLYTIFAGVSVFESAQLEQNATRADAFFREAQKVDLLKTLDNEVGIELVQLLLLMGRYLQSTERFSKCKNISGLAIRLAQNMGLQYSTSEARARGLLLSSSTQLECEMRARVWQGCVILER